jgi:hypothetical protein
MISSLKDIFRPASRKCRKTIPQGACAGLAPVSIAALMADAGAGHAMARVQTQGSTSSGGTSLSAVSALAGGLRAPAARLDVATGAGHFELLDGAQAAQARGWSYVAHTQTGPNSAIMHFEWPERRRSWLIGDGMDAEAGFLDAQHRAGWSFVDTQPAGFLLLKMTFER